MLSFRKATLADTKLYFDWANDSDVREQSYNSTAIDFENHKKDRILVQNINDLKYQSVARKEQLYLRKINELFVSLLLFLQLY